MGGPLNSRKAWPARLESWIEDRNSPYRAANVGKLESCLVDDNAGARMVVNLGAASLLRFLADGRYKNFYDLRAEGSVPVMGSGGVDPDAERRESVDRLMDFVPDGSGVYFGAVAMESAGVRYYGEWSLVLASAAEGTQIVDRDSYEFAFPPLCNMRNRNAIAKALRGQWGRDLLAMAALKMRDEVGETTRLVTEGRMRHALLRGEEFIEVHRVGTFTPSEVREVRQAAVDTASRDQIATSYDHGVVPTLEQIVWSSERAAVERSLDAAHIPTRVVDAEVVR